LAAGTRVMLTNNPDPVLRLFAGSIGTVLGFFYYDTQPSNSHANIPAYAMGIVAPHCNTAENAAAQDIQLPIVLVQIDKNCYRNKTFTLSNFQGESTPNVVPIAPISLTFKYQNQKIVRTQVPLMLSSCITIHKCQALTVNNLVWVLGKLFERGLSYVPPGRVTSGAGLFIVKTIQNTQLSTTDMNKFQPDFYDIHREYERLRAGQRTEARRIALATANIAYLQSYDYDEIPHFPIVPETEEYLKAIKKSEDCKTKKRGKRQQLDNYEDEFRKRPCKSFIKFGVVIIKL
jgi:hypothetical protein